MLLVLGKALLLHLKLLPHVDAGRGRRTALNADAVFVDRHYFRPDYLPRILKQDLSFQRILAGATYGQLDHILSRFRCFWNVLSGMVVGRVAAVE